MTPLDRHRQLQRAGRPRELPALAEEEPARDPARHRRRGQRARRTAAPTRRSGSPACARSRWARNAGFSAANNAGIRASRGELLLLLNSDTLVPPGALDALIARLESATRHRRRRARAWSTTDGRPELSFGRMISPLERVAAEAAGPRAWIAARDARREQFVDWVSGACLLVRRDDAERSGCSTSGSSCTPRTWTSAHAIGRLGRQILFTPAATITHLRGRSRAGDAGSQPPAVSASHLAFYQKHHPLSRLPAACSELAISRLTGRKPGARNTPSAHTGDR